MPRHYCSARDGGHFCECSVNADHWQNECRADDERLPRFMEHEPSDAGGDRG